MTDSIRLNIIPRVVVAAPPPSSPPPVVVTPPPVVTPPRDSVVPPPVRVVEPPPTRPADPPPVSEAVIAERQIRQLVADYAGALTARNIGDVTRLYPTLPRVEREGWVGLFDQRVARDLQVTYRIENVEVSGNTGVVRVAGEHQFTMQSPRKPCRLPVSMNLRVTSASGAWRIASVQQLGRTQNC
jgi:hypothetical protein